MARVRRNDSPAEERRAIAYAIAWMERRVAPTVGAANYRPNLDFAGSGDDSSRTASMRPTIPRAIFWS